MVNEDEKLLNWVDKKYPNLGEIIMKNSWNYWRLGNNYVKLPFAKLPLVMSLAKIAGFDIRWMTPPSKKTYNKTIKKLKKHITDNPDVILFTLL